MSNPFDISKRLPNYINKWVFRYAVLIILFLFIFTANSNDWRNDFVYIECPASSLNGCYVIKDFTDIDSQIPEEWNGAYLYAGQSLGNKPNDHFFKFNERVWIIILLAFILNQVLYSLKEGKMFPKGGIKK